jgi:Flp pilus assembly protein TadG
VAIYEGYGMTRLKRSRRDQSGASAVEFALLIIPFTVLLFGLIEFGFYFWTAQTTSGAARETARRVVVGDCWDQTAATTYARSQAPRLTGNVTWTPAPSTIPDVGDRITVTLTSNSGIINFIPGIPDTVTRSYDARMEELEDSGTCN